jgi:septum formation protein
MNEIVLASASKYRKELLSRLGLAFVSQAPALDEEKHKDPALAPRALAEKLAFLKAQSLAHPQKTVIGGDQLVAFEGRILGKPHSAEKARAQLQALQGKTHELITAVCVVAGEQVLPFTNVTRLTMKMLSPEQITRYVELDQPLDCAGSYKIELHGISLFEKIESDDFTAIQGLPLIQLSQVLHNLGYGTLGV